MTYETYEDSRYHGAPISLFRFACGDRVYCYTDHELAVTYASETYLPVPIDRDKIAESGTMDKKVLSVTLPHDSPISNLFLAYPPSDVTTLIIRQGHLGDPDSEFKVVWTGRVLSCSRKKSQATLSCEPVTTSMRRNGLRRRYQFGCPYVLYGPECGLNKALFTVNVSVVEANGSRITLPSGWTSRDPSKYLEGVVEWTNSDGHREVRTIKRIENNGMTLMLSYNTNGLAAGTTVAVSLGCNHKAGLPTVQTDGDCLPVFNNIANFGGQPWIPFKNPIRLTNSYY